MIIHVGRSEFPTNRNIPDALQALIATCWAQDPIHRPSAEEALADLLLVAPDVQEKEREKGTEEYPSPFETVILERDEKEKETKVKEKEQKEKKEGPAWDGVEPTVASDMFYSRGSVQSDSISGKCSSLPDKVEPEDDYIQYRIVTQNYGVIECYTFGSEAQIQEKWLSYVGWSFGGWGFDGKHLGSLTTVAIRRRRDGEWESYYESIPVGRWLLGFWRRL